MEENLKDCSSRQKRKRRKNSNSNAIALDQGRDASYIEKEVDCKDFQKVEKIGFSIWLDPEGEQTI